MTFKSVVGVSHIFRWTLSLTTRDLDRQVLHAGALNGLRVELHQVQDFLRHADLDRQPQRVGEIAHLAVHRNGDRPLGERLRDACRQLFAGDVLGPAQSMARRPRVPRVTASRAILTGFEVSFSIGYRWVRETDDAGADLRRLGIVDGRLRGK